jgi:hypothetical protein
MYLSCRRLIFSAIILTGLATSAFAQGDGDRVERGSQSATEAAAKAVLYKRIPPNPPVDDTSDRRPGGPRP